MRQTGEATPESVGAAVRAALSAALAATLAAGAVLAWRALGDDPGRPDITDFDVFHLVGRLALEGRIADAYRQATMAPLEAALGGGRAVAMPYGYPPAFGLLAAALARLPAGAACALFSAATLALFAAVLRRLAGPWFWTALLAASPSALVSLLVGQNGLLTAALAGLATALALAPRGGRGLAGVAAGALFALKPQAGLGPPLVFLARGHLAALAATGATAALLTGLAVALLGPAVVPAALAGLAESGRFMAEGRFPLHRMASVYAAALGLGAPAGLAMALHAGAALLAFGGAVALGRDGADRPAAAGAALIAAGFASPYLYDYDLPVLGMGLALVLPAMARALGPGGLRAWLAAIAVAEGAGMAQSMLLATRLPVAGPLLLVAYGVMVAALSGRLSRARVAGPLPAG